MFATVTSTGLVDLNNGDVIGFFDFFAGGSGRVVNGGDITEGPSGNGGVTLA
jgi:hypothetical protein